jgi:hypothetical protein
LSLDIAVGVALDLAVVAADDEAADQAAVAADGEAADLAAVAVVDADFLAALANVVCPGTAA